MSTSRHPEPDPAAYFRRRLDYLRSCYLAIEKKLEEERARLCDTIDRGELDEKNPAVGKMSFHLEIVIGNTFRYTMLVGICTYLEEFVQEIGRRMVSDYDARLKKEKKGNWLGKNIRIFWPPAGAAVSNLQRDIDDFLAYITLRNCIAHAWGRVQGALDPTAVRKAVDRAKPWVRISRDGYLLLSDQVLPGALAAARHIASGLLRRRVANTLP